MSEQLLSETGAAQSELPAVGLDVTEARAAGLVTPERAWQKAVERTRQRSPGSFDQWFCGVQRDGLFPASVRDSDGGALATGGVVTDDDSTAGVPSRDVISARGSEASAHADAAGLNAGAAGACASGCAWQLSLTARDEFVRDWVKTHFQPSLLSELESELGLTPPARVDVVWSVSRELDTPVCPPPRPSVPPADVAVHSSQGVGLNAAVSHSSHGQRGAVASVAPASASSVGLSRVSTSHPPTSSTSPTSSASALRAPPPLRLRSVMTPSGDFLNPKFTFANFVVGPSNELAYAAAAASAGAQGRRYNPLFLCGGTGLGKTHLMHAIAHRMLEMQPDACVIYVSAERFTNEFIEALQHHKMEEFRSRYRRHCDVLLVDDIQFLAGREQTQEEFFHTFNVLHDAGKPIVVSSDKYPQDLARMPERLISRFTSGLVADVHVPALETRVAIVKKKAELEGIALSDAVAVILAQAVKSNVRELEGALIRLAARSSLTGRSIDEELTRSEISSTLPRQSEVKSVEDIQRVVCNHFRLSNAELLSKDRHKSVAFARQVAMYLCRQRLKCSFPELGRAFGNRDHTTVMSAVRRVEALRQTDPQVNAHLEALAQKLAADG